jgi:catechol 2,3-dioxygenase-like lactoylglutathione lyase family enzyme
VRIDRLDHLVLTVADIDATMEFYTGVLGMRAVTFGAGRMALAFGHSKINLHRAGQEFEPKTHRPTPGSADLCLIAAGRMAHQRGNPLKRGDIRQASTAWSGPAPPLTVSGRVTVDMRIPAGAIARLRR